MNPLVSQKIKQITKAVEDLKGELIEAQEQLENLTEIRNELQKKNWAQAKEIAVFKERLDELTDLRHENKRLIERIQEFEQRLQRILEYAEALEAEFRP
jgi:methyl-accepting chemotaxis protein